MSVVIPELNVYHARVPGLPSDGFAREPLNNLCGSQHLVASEMIVNGGEIGDIPTSYQIPSPLKHELIVVGNYVHKYILPGFKYRVRKNGTDKYLFERRALFLESVGQGYGKRLTFESDDVLSNENMFWSDSSETGFAFAIEAIEEGSVYCVNGDELKVTNVDSSQEVVRTFLQGKNFYMEVRVKFHCEKLALNGDAISQTMEGTVMLLKEKGHRRAKVVSFNC